MDRDVAIAFLRRTYPEFSELVEEYIGEAAEEGSDYWDNFANAYELVEDFDLYIKFN